MAIQMVTGPRAIQNTWLLVSISNRIRDIKSWNILITRTTIPVSLVLKFILLDRTLNRRLRFEALESCIFPALLYGCQTWKLTENLRHIPTRQDPKHQNKSIGKHSWSNPASDNSEMEMGRTLHSSRRAQLSTMWDPCIGADLLQGRLVNLRRSQGCTGLRQQGAGRLEKIVAK